MNWAKAGRGLGFLTCSILNPSIKHVSILSSYQSDNMSPDPTSYAETKSSKRVKGGACSSYCFIKGSTHHTIGWSVGVTMVM